MRTETPFNPEQTNALLDMQDIDDVAMCATNRYAVEEMDDTTTLTCDQFGDFGCMAKNDDLLPVLTKTNGGCGSTTYVPTMFPSENLSLMFTGIVSTSIFSYLFNNTQQHHFRLRFQVSKLTQDRLSFEQLFLTFSPPLQP